MRINSRNRNLCVSLNMTDSGNLVKEAVMKQHKLGHDEGNMPQIVF